MRSVTYSAWRVCTLANRPNEKDFHPWRNRSAGSLNRIRPNRPAGRSGFDLADGKEGMAMRGFAAIGLDRPKNPANLGGVLRAAYCYGAAVVVIGGDRVGKYATDTMKAWRHIPCIEVPDVMDGVPFSTIPVVVELCDRAKNLVNFAHPERAYYIFGPEDGSVKRSIVDRVPLVVQIPMNGCMNLAASVNVILYDRLAKQSARLSDA